VHTGGAILRAKENHLAIFDDFAAKRLLGVHNLIATGHLHTEIEQDKRFAKAANRGNQTWNTGWQYVFD
jgi:hypothetical protein